MQIMQITGHDWSCVVKACQRWHSPDVESEMEEKISAAMGTQSSMILLHIYTDLKILKLHSM